MRNLFNLALRLLSTISGKSVLYISNKSIQPSHLAAKSKYGFWYAGNVYDQSDIAYGVAQNGTVEDFDTEIVASILKTLPSNFVFFDIGANTGWYSMLAASLSQSSSIHSFEPLSEHVECLAESVSVNRYTERVHIHKLALSNTQGYAEILLAGSGSSLNKNFLGKSAKTRKIRTEILDVYLQNNHLSFPDFIKIDVEGHEHEVLEGATVVLGHHPILFIEAAQSLKKLKRDFINEHFEEMFKMLEEKGYKIFFLQDERVCEYVPTKKIDGVYMYLCLHPSSHLELLSRYA
jgi:FkbM family methyltransferase